MIKGFIVITNRKIYQIWEKIPVNKLSF